MIQKLRIFIALCLGFFLLPSNKVDALVAITNGNYFTGFVDINYPSPGAKIPLKWERTQNSRSQYDGYLGYGWGTEFESFVIVSADGSAIVQESGGGERTRYIPTNYGPQNVKEYVKVMVKEKAKKQNTNFNLQEYEERLTRDAEFRDEEGRTLGVSPQLAVGTKLFSTERGDKQSITVIKDGFLREFGDRRKVYFTFKTKVKDSGVGLHRRVINVYKISKIEDIASGAALTLKYNKNTGFLEEISDGQTQALTFTNNSDGKITSAKDKKGHTAVYKYCAQTRYDTTKKCGPGDLIESTDAANNTYKYEYDNVHDLTKIIYSDGTAEEISYWPPAPPGEGGTKSVRTRKGILTEYTYWSDPKDRRMHFKTEVKTTFRSGRVSNASYEYERKRRADGSSYKYRMITIVDGEKTDTIYNECCGQPVQITEASGITKFDYYPDSNLPKRRDTPQETTSWEYSTVFRGKVTKVSVAKKGPQAKAMETAFDYNEKGNLKQAKTSDGRGVALIYDSLGRIKTMVDQEKRKISFQYNESSKPYEIRQEGVGAIIIVYDAQGNIKEVQPKGDKDVALTVTEAFQNLLEIIKPTGIQPI